MPEQTARLLRHWNASWDALEQALASAQCEEAFSPLRLREHQQALADERKLVQQLLG